MDMTSELAAALEADCTEVLGSYQRALDELGGPIAEDPVARQHTTAHAGQTWDDVIDSLRAGQVRVNERCKMPIQESALTSTASEVELRDSLRSGALLFDVALRHLVQRLGVEGDVGKALTLAIGSLYRTTTACFEEGLVLYSGYLLNEIHKAQVDERHRIARELHDWIGLWLSTAHHQLELYEIDKQRKGQSGACERVAKASEAVQEAMRTLRAVTSELRLVGPQQNLVKALLTAFDSLPSENATVTLNVNGDETWAPAAVKDESFLIILEAVRNAVAHGNPERILVNVHIAPHELRTYIDDDGSGFDPEQLIGNEGVGLSSMRERTELLGGEFSISSSPGGGTHVKIFIPFPGRGR
jgi:signal transduction histidine kinase